MRSLVRDGAEAGRRDQARVLGQGTATVGDLPLRQGIQPALQHRRRQVDVDGGGVEVDGDDVALFDGSDGATGLGFGAMWPTTIP